MTNCMSIFADCGCTAAFAIMICNHACTWWHMKVQDKPLFDSNVQVTSQVAAVASMSHKLSRQIYMHTCFTSRSIVLGAQVLRKPLHSIFSLYNFDCMLRCDTVLPLKLHFIVFLQYAALSSLHRLYYCFMVADGW